MGLFAWKQKSEYYVAETVGGSSETAPPFIRILLVAPRQPLHLTATLSGVLAARSAATKRTPNKWLADAAPLVWRWLAENFLR